MEEEALQPPSLEYFIANTLPRVQVGSNWPQVSSTLPNVQRNLMSPSSSYFKTQIIFPFSHTFPCIFYITPINAAEEVKHAGYYFEPIWKKQTDLSAFFAYLPFH